MSFEKGYACDSRFFEVSWLQEAQCHFKVEGPEKGYPCDLGFFEVPLCRRVSVTPRLEVLKKGTLVTLGFLAPRVEGSVSPQGCVP